MTSLRKPGRFGPGTHRHRIPCPEEGKRKYLVHAPASYEPSTPVPLVIPLHGGGGAAVFAHRIYGWSELAEKKGFLVVYPEAAREDPARPASFRDNPRIWNDGSRRSQVAKRNVDDVGYLNTVLDLVQENYAVDSDRIFVTGFSNGASMAFRVGVEMADRVAAIAPVSGHLCRREPKPARPVSMLYMIGLLDPLNPFEGGPMRTPWGASRNKPPIMESIETWIRLIEAPEHPYLVRHDDGVKQAHYGPGRNACEVHLYTIENQGHEWPGAPRTLPVAISGPQTDRLNATEIIWEFFASAVTQND